MCQNSRVQSQRIISLKAGNSQKESRKLIEKEKLGKAATSMNTAVGKGSLLLLLHSCNYIVLFIKHLWNFIKQTPILYPNENNQKHYLKKDFLHR